MISNNDTFTTNMIEGDFGSKQVVFLTLGGGWLLIKSESQMTQSLKFIFHKFLNWELLCHQLVWIVLTLFLSVHSFMLPHANGTNWVNISELQIFIVSGRVLKQCYLHNNMKCTENNNVYIIVICVVITVNYCKCILLSYSPLNSYLNVHWLYELKLRLLLCNI